MTTNPTPEVVEAEAIPTAAAAAVGFGHALDNQRARQIYGPNSQYSLFRDVFHSRFQYGDTIGAGDRLRTFEAQRIETLQAMEGQRLDTFAAPGQVQSDLSVFLPSGYRPDLYIGDLRKGRPATSHFRSIAVSSSRAFTIPTTSASSGLAAVTSEEGSNNATGTLTDTAISVDPDSYQAIYIVSRDAVDSATPGLEEIAFAEMREAYARVTEAVTVAALEAIKDTNSDVNVTAAQTAAGGATYLEKVLETVGTFMAADFNPPTGILMSTEDMQVSLIAAGTSHRYLQENAYPGFGAGMTLGATGEPGVFGYLAGVPLVHSWGNTDYTSHIVHRDRTVWVFESPVLAFNYSEVLGPASIKLALWGYFDAVAVKSTACQEILRATT